MLTSEPVPVEPTVPVKRGRGRPKSKKNSQELQSSSKSKRKSVYKKQPPVLQCPDSVHENDDLELNYLATEKVLNKPKISQLAERLKTRLVLATLKVALGLEDYSVRHLSSAASHSSLKYYKARLEPVSTVPVDHARFDDWMTSAGVSQKRHIPMNYSSRPYYDYQHQRQHGYSKPINEQVSPPIGIYSSKMDGTSTGHVYPSSLPAQESNPMDIYFMTTLHSPDSDSLVMNPQNQGYFSADPLNGAPPPSVTDMEERVFGEFLRE